MGSDTLCAGVVGILGVFGCLYAICEYLSGDVFLQLFFFYFLFWGESLFYVSDLIYNSFLEILDDCGPLIGGGGEFLDLVVGRGAESCQRAEGRKVHVSTSRE